MSRERLAAPVTAVLVLAVLVLAACTSAPGGGSADRLGEDPGATAAPAPVVGSYVALGDSFTAAPYVPSTDLAGGCLRSDGNYPRLVAEALEAELTDVSCSAADTADIERGQAVGLGGASLPPQLRAVREDADLVTVGIGGNDGDLFATLAFRCTALAAEQQPCREVVAQALGDTARLVAATGRRVTRALQAVRRAAPDALVVLVGYPRLVAAGGGCPAMPVADADVPLLVGLEESLNAALAAAAAAAGAAFVDMHGPSTGHEVCSDDPWVNGRTTDQRRALAFHPFAAGQQAVADAVLAAVEEAG